MRKKTESTNIRNCLLMIALFCAGTASNPALADILLIERVQKAQTIDMPERGSNMQQVRQAYGEPQSIRGPVGEPPITTWVYPHFSCYFEHQWVINCVVNKISPLEKGPKPPK